MEDDERHGNAPNVGLRASPESSTCSKNNNNNNKEQDRFLPIANVGRIMKKAIPGNGKISKDAKETVQECVSEFISFVTGEASDKCQREKRKTINGDDILWAITTLGFEDYVNPLKLYLNKYRELEGEKLNVPKQQQQQQHHQQQQNVVVDHQNSLNLAAVYNACSSNVYTSSNNSPAGLLSHHPPYVSSSDHHLQPFLNLPFPTHQNTIQAQFTQQEHITFQKQERITFQKQEHITFQKQEHIDSVGHWQ
ncbi:PREDICTED: nuclear transcription factor Y subunit B-7-like [Ipomoea nil]|uniref:nuclear transcription factor Y subunit B-7-like n=1 Tax=Ipomoea nil TaxID=35883 RepID=UPI000900E660|nr:PREDICTED: nuclear transcription factor Y subunit B-7-like [Ipomoea nil]